ncbi:helix-turn-helix domain-containing protein [Chloroflexia bacterium SDU3-3]|nr:helix-turn-helix domain-containing protein [Chloroflexia bacterium SDU3-3]
MYNPSKAAEWLSERLGRTVSRQTIQLYIKRGDLPATNTGAGQHRPTWVILHADLEAFADRAAAEGLPTPKGGWPQRNAARKKANGLVTIASH